MARHITCYSILFSSLMVCAGALTGCISSGSTGRYIPSFSDPDFLGKRYNRLAVHYETDDLYYRKAIEEKLVEELRKKKANALESSAIIAPTRTWDSAAARRALLAAGVDGYVRIAGVEEWTETYHIPAQRTTKVTREAEQKKLVDTTRSGEQRKDTVIKVIEAETTTTTTTGGYDEAITWTRLRIELIDLPTGRTAWLGTTTVRGSLSHGAEEFGKQVAGQLRADGIVDSR